MANGLDTIRVGIVGLGANTRLRHVPGLRACRQVEIIGVCNRSLEVLLVGKRGDELLQAVEIPVEMKSDWRVEAEFINAIRGTERIQFTDFASGLRYMQFTQAVAESLMSNAFVTMSK